jgi:hypothetical protein
MINIEVSKHATFTPLNGLPTHPTDNEVHVFTQFFIHPTSSQRNKEMKYCLYENYLNPHITKIHLLNERIYSNEELYGNNSTRIENAPSGKVVQVNINKRLTFKDVFHYIRKNGIYGYCVFTNADIFFDRTIHNVLFTSISQKRQAFALLRYEYKGQPDLTKSLIFGPRFDSQDTWIVHFSKNTSETNETGTSPPNTFYVKENQEKAFDFEFGRPGCDNKFAYLLNVFGCEIINDPRFIKTYHYHIETTRDYTTKDRVLQPYSLTYPAGFNPYTTPVSFGVNIKSVIESTNGFQQIRFDDNELLYNYITKKLEKNEKFIIPRISGHENNFAFFGKVIQQNIANGIQPVIPNEIQSYFQQTIPIMKRNAGIRLSNLDSIIKYSNQYLRAFENCEMYGGWESWGHYMPHIAHSHQFIKNNFSSKQIFWVFAMDIYHYIYSRPFTTALKGKRILIVSPFESSIRAKLDIRSQLYDGVDLFPECSFLFITPPVTNGDNISDEFDIELTRFYGRLNGLRGKYDVALLSCGGYANPVANYIYENHGASAIYIGGVLQMYFGIYGGRWLKERADILKLFMNEHWSRPSNSEKPNNYTAIENGCYW